MNADFLKQLADKNKKSDDTNTGGNSSTRKKEEKKEKKKYDSEKIFEELDDSKKEAEIKHTLDLADLEKQEEKTMFEQIKQGELKKYENESSDDAYKNLLKVWKEYNNVVSETPPTFTSVGENNFLLDLMTSDAVLNSPINTNYDDPKSYLNTIPKVHKAAWYDVNKKAQFPFYSPSGLANFLKGEFLTKYTAIGTGALLMSVSPIIGLFVMLYYFMPSKARETLKSELSKKTGIPFDKIDSLTAGYDDYVKSAGKELKKKFKKAQKKKKGKDKETENKYDIAQARYEAAVEREKKKEEEKEKKEKEEKQKKEKEEKEKKELLEKYQKKDEEKENKNDTVDINKIIERANNNPYAKDIFLRLKQNLDNPEYCARHPELVERQLNNDISVIDTTKKIVDNFIEGLDNGKKFKDIYDNISLDENANSILDFVILKLYGKESQQYNAEKKFIEIKNGLDSSKNNYTNVDLVKNKIDNIIFELKNGKDITTIIQEGKSDKNTDSNDFNKLINSYYNLEIDDVKNLFDQKKEKKKTDDLEKEKKKKEDLDNETVATKKLLDEYFNKKNKKENEEEEKNQGRY